MSACSGLGHTQNFLARMTGIATVNISNREYYIFLCSLGVDPGINGCLAFNHAVCSDLLWYDRTIGPDFFGQTPVSFIFPSLSG